MIKTAEQNGYDMRVLRAVEEVNEIQKSALFEKLLKLFNNKLKDKTIEFGDSLSNPKLMICVKHPHWSS